MTSPVLSALRLVRDEIQTQADKAIGAAEKRAELVVRAAEQERDEARSEAEALNIMITELEGSIEELEERAGKSKAAAEKAEQRVVELEKDLAAVNARLEVYDELKSKKKNG